MAYAPFLPLLTAVREVLVGKSGELRSIPDTRFTDDLAEGLREEELARRGVVAKKPFRVRISESTPHPASPPIGGNLILYRVQVEVIVSRTIGPAEQLSADKLAELEATQWEDADIIRQALETGPNLRLTRAAAATDLASSALRWVRTRGRLVVPRDPTAAQRYESVHVFGGALKSRPGIAPAPVFVTPPTIYVAGAADPEVGATLIADPGEVTGAHTERGQWMRDGAPIDGASRVRYELIEADEGASLIYRRTAIGSGGTTTAESNAIVPGVAVLPEGFPIPDPRLLLIAGHGHVEIDGGVEILTDVASGYSFEADTAPQRPTLETSPAMGQPALRFARAAETLLSTTARELGRPVHYPAAGATVFIAWHLAAYAGVQVLFDSCNLIPSAAGLTLYLSDAGGGRLGLRVGAAGGVVLDGAWGLPVPAAAPHYAVVRLLTGGSPEYEVRVDGALAASGTFAGAPQDAPSAQSNRIGGRTSAGSAYDGHLGCYGQIDRRIDDAELATLEAWLSRYTPA